ncbi:RrF2 family transcriptional regulator [Brochothrix campestris]|uniref:Transcriptional regulator n=1 Tax=Brochothrix campestris FSL F6-1037 TaxID=1265861 RepID=W7CE67_9LIST|nr:Rrf2 family transcriptional regulator [Brochothrix campestris]EUJ35485.1 hypothetical protein BCAMP_11845 [Brochothrix campestris FSL F6-1037]
MKFSKSMKQAICIMVLLATQTADKSLKSQDISERLQMSQAYLKKIMRKLVVADLIKSVSGNNGGYMIAKSIDEMTLYDIYYAVCGPVQTFSDEDDMLLQAFSGGMYAEDGLQALEKVFLQMDAGIERFLKGIIAGPFLTNILGVTDIPQVDWTNRDQNISSK